MKHLLLKSLVEKVKDYINSSEFKAYGNAYKISFEGENEEVMDTLTDLFFAMMIFSSYMIYKS